MLKEKKNLRRLGRIVAFLLVLSMVWMGCTALLLPRNNTKASGMDSPSARGFYAEPENSIDLFFIGNSDAYCGFSPMELWNSYGYTSYVCGEAKQHVPQAIKLLNEILKKHKPKVIVLETDSFFTSGSTLDQLTHTMSAMANTMLPLLRYHDLWKQFKLSNFWQMPEYSTRSIEKGQKLSNEVDPYTGGPYTKETDTVREFPIGVELLLDDFRAICEKNHISLLLVEVPSASSWSYEKHNAVQAYADANGLPFLDLDIRQEELDFDWSTDTRDAGNHLNCRGAKKVTEFVGSYLHAHYDLPDHRSDPTYEQWHSDYLQYSRIVNT